MNINIDITRMIEAAVNKAIAEAIETELDAAKQRFVEKIRGSVGAIAATVTQRLSFERIGNELIIRLQIDTPTHREVGPVDVRPGGMFAASDLRK